MEIMLNANSPFNPRNLLHGNYVKCKFSIESKEFKRIQDNGLQVLRNLNCTV